MVHEYPFIASKATLNDLAELIDLRNDALQFKLSRGDEAWETEPFTENEIKPGIERGVTYLFRIDGQAAGSVVLLLEDKHVWGKKGLDGTAGYVHSLATSSVFRGQGIGTEILQWCSEELRSKGRTTIRLDAPSSNQELRSYYEKEGFELAEINGDSALYERATS